MLESCRLASLNYPISEVRQLL